MIRRPPRSTLFPYTDALPIWSTRSFIAGWKPDSRRSPPIRRSRRSCPGRLRLPRSPSRRYVTTSSRQPAWVAMRSEEHTSELQSRQYLVCRLLLEKKKQSYSFTVLIIIVLTKPIIPILTHLTLLLLAYLHIILINSSSCNTFKSVLYYHNHSQMLQ